MNETKLNGESMDIVADNVQKLKAIFPEVFCEDSIDFEKLQAVLGNYIDTDNERYNFTWWGKSQALRLAQTPSTGTLRPCKEESKDWDTTQNLYIEGDNLEVLKLLQKTYHGKVKIIYIDPPYNTGKDFVYRDNFIDSIKNYKQITGQIDNEGNYLMTNSESSGRFHTEWLNMIYPRLKLARNLLTDDGVIFISIDHKESHNLRKVCDEVFGEGGFVCSAVWRSSDNSNNDAKQFSNDHNDTLIYSKQPLWQPQKQSDEKKRNHFKNPDNDPRGPYFDGNPLNSPNYRENLCYNIVSPSGNIITPPQNGWRWSKETLEEKLKTGEIRFNDTETGVKRRTYLCDMEGLPPSSLWIDLEKTGHNRQAKYDLLNLLPENVFDTPKPAKLIKYIINLVKDNKNAIILDFFSGSGTTADAVMQLNCEDGGCRKYIMVQLPEDLDETYKKATNDKKVILANAIKLCDTLGVKHRLSEVAKERIRRAGEKLKEDRIDTKIDIGFKVFKLDTSNIKKWIPNYDNLESTLFDQINNFVEGRTELDVVFEIMLKYGIDLTLQIEEYEVSGKKVYSVGFGALIICLDNDITTDLAMGIIKLKEELSPGIMRVVFKDNGFKNDSVKTNVKEIFKVNGIDEMVSI